MKYFFDRATNIFYTWIFFNDLVEARFVKIIQENNYSITEIQLSDISLMF